MTQHHKITRAAGALTLGERFSDSMTGKEGVATQVAIYPEATARLCLCEMDSEGVPRHTWYDLSRVFPNKHKKIAKSLYKLVPKEIKFGEDYVDCTSGLKAKASGYVIHVTGCNQVALDYLDTRGNQHTASVDETRLASAKTFKQSVKEDKTRPPGCDNSFDTRSGPAQSLPR